MNSNNNLVEYMNKIDLCLQIATKAHAGQIDKNGEPYILHPLAVGLMGATDEERMAGFLHDVVEDCDWTFEKLLEAGVPEGVVGALRLLTHEEPKTRLTSEEFYAHYMAYVQRIIDSRNPIALKVKRNDLTHNLSRSASNEHFLRKYEPALAKVTAAIEERSRVALYNPACRENEPANQEVGTAHGSTALAIFACGCFWGVQHLFARQKGVLRTFVGYTGGEEKFPHYEDVRAQKTGHAEAIAVEYDPMETDYKQLCQFFFEIHDPAQTDGQGPDKGAQYRSVIFYKDEEQKNIAEAVIADLRSRGYEVNTQLVPATDFWLAEDFHQDYYELTGGSPYCHVRTKKF